MIFMVERDEVRTAESGAARYIFYHLCPTRYFKSALSVPTRLAIKSTSFLSFANAASLIAEPIYPQKPTSVPLIKPMQTIHLAPGTNSTVALPRTAPNPVFITQLIPKSLRRACNVGNLSVLSEHDICPFLDLS